ncbi:MAG: oligosaccharide flippase family protein, partial [Nitrososphaerota archaeon]
MDDKYREIFVRSEIGRDLGRKAVRSSFVIMGSEIASSLLRIGSTVVLARLLLPEDFGLLSMVSAITVFAERFKDLGLSDATVQAKDITHSQVSSLFWINLVVCIAIGSALASLSKVIAWFYHEPRLVGVSLVLASTFLFSGLVIQHQALLRRQLHFGALVFINLSSIVLSVVGAIMLACYGFGYWALVAREFFRSVFLFL